MRQLLKARILIGFWLIHCLATAGGHYFVTAMAQGAADAGIDPPLSLTIFNTFVQILSFPVLTLATNAMPVSIDLWSVSGAATLAGFAAVNSAIWAAVGAAVYAAVRKSSA